MTVVHATAPLMPDPALVIAAIHVVQTKDQAQRAPEIVEARLHTDSRGRFQGRDRQ